MITNVKIQNYKALKDVEVSFDKRLTVIVGPNGCGKSSLLRLLNLFTELNDHKLGIQDSTRTSSNYRKAEPSIIKNYIINELKGTNSDANKFYTSLYISCDAQDYSISISNDVNASDLSNKLGLLQKTCRSEYIQFFPHLLSEVSSTTSIPPEFRSDGYGLPSMLAWLKLYHEHIYYSIIRELRSIIKNIDNVKIGRLPIDKQLMTKNIYGESLEIELNCKNSIPAHHLSTGTLILLGLLAKIRLPHRPNVIFIDDVDNGFHPKAQLQLVDLLHKLLDEMPDLQIIATTHSPYILSKLDWEEIRVAYMDEDGWTTIRPLSDHPNVAKWKEEMNPGEFWSHAGEDWIAKLPKKAAAA